MLFASLLPLDMLAFSVKEGPIGRRAYMAVSDVKNATYVIDRINTGITRIVAEIQVINPPAEDVFLCG
jgi:hypothetical protein